MIKQLLTVIIGVGWVNVSNAQVTLSDTSLEKKTTFAVNYYNKNISEQAEIYNGPEYNFLPRSAKGTPFLDDKYDLSNATLRYNGIWYTDIPLLYDIYKDILVGTQPQYKSSFILQEQYVTDFFLLGHHFVHVPAIDNNKGKLREGYYEQLYAGKSIVMCKYEKIRIETINTQGVDVTFFDKQTYYINKGGTIYNVSSKGSVLDVFKDKKNELNSYLKTKEIDFKENKGLAMAKIAAYYDQISN